MVDGRINQKIDPRLHEEMKKIITMKGGGTTLYEEYNLAVKNHIKRFYQENVIEKSEIEKILDEKFKKMDRHLASMLGRTGMDASMILMGLTIFLEHYFKANKEDIFKRLREDGARYYTRPEKKDK